MSDDDATDRATKADRVSLRAVLVPAGGDVAAALAAAGIHDPISLPFVFGDASFASGAVLGDGRTPNLVATLEFDKLAGSDRGVGSSKADFAAPPDDGPIQDTGTPAARTAPDAYGFRSFAPMRNRQMNVADG